MRNILKKPLGRASEDQKGFTLIELLVVVGIIVALAAVIVPLVVQFADKGTEGAKAAELNTIQAAVDSMMADKELTTLTANSTSGKITTSSTFTSGGQTLSAYLRDASTVYCYTWVGSGKITQTTC